MRMILALLALTATLRAAPSHLDWPQFKGGPARLGQGPALRLPVDLAWRTQIPGSSYSSPAIAQGLVVLGSSAKRLLALDLVNGGIRWERTLPGRIWGSSPAIAGGRAYVGSVEGCVHGVDLANSELASSFCNKSRGWRGADVLSSPLIDQGRLYFGADDRNIYAYDLSTGQELWRRGTGGIIHDNGAAVGGGLIFMPSRDHKLYALDPKDGAVKWAFEGLKEFNTVPVYADGRVYAGNADGYVYALDAASGVKLWSRFTGRGVMSSPALDGAGTLYVGAADKNVYALETATGHARWTFKTGDIVLASPLVTGNLVWIGSYDGKLYALDRVKGEERWSMPLKGGVFTSLAVSGDRLVATGRDGDVVCLRATPDPAYRP